jgi:N-acetylglucosamine repressor
MRDEIRKRIDLTEMELRVIRKLLIKAYTIADISKSIGRSLPSTTTLFRILEEKGWIKKSGMADSTGGRRAKLFQLIPEARWVMGIDLGRHSTRFICIDLKGTLLHSEVFPSPDLSKDKKVISTLEKWQAKVLANSKLNSKECLGIGVGLPGLVNSETGISHTYLTTDPPIEKILSEKFKLPVNIINDAKAMAYGECCAGVGKGRKDLILINIGWGGVGMGAIINDKPHYGSHFQAGEFGHTPCDPNGDLCSCGKCGCLETICSGSGMVRQVVKALKNGEKSSMLEKTKGNPENVTVEMFVESIKNGDALAIRILIESTQVFGKHLATAIAWMDPDIVIIGGYIASAGAILVDSIRAATKANILPALASNVKIVTSGLGDMAAAMGAAQLILEPFLPEKN